MFRKDAYNSVNQGLGRECRGDFRRKFEKLQHHLFNDSAPFAGKGDHKAYIPVNIVETDEFYQIQVFAAGRKKDQFQVNITEQVLTITCKEAEVEPGLKYVYQEQHVGAFKRAFRLQDDLLIENVHASYEEGILTVILKKDPDKMPAGQEVLVS